MKRIILKETPNINTNKENSCFAPKVLMKRNNIKKKRKEKKLTHETYILFN